MSDKRYTDEELTAAILNERERCAEIAEQRCADDHGKYHGETNWRMPWGFNRVIRASMDIAAAIRARPSQL